MWKITILGDRHDGADKLHEEHFNGTSRRPPIRRPSSWTSTADCGPTWTPFDKGGGLRAAPNR